MYGIPALDQDHHHSVFVKSRDLMEMIALWKVFGTCMSRQPNSTIVGILEDLETLFFILAICVPVAGYASDITMF